jgi:predicted nucleic acid-binding protein
MSRSSHDVICDAGPLIHLHELSCLDLLSGFHRVLVPDQVWREVEHHRPGALELSGVEIQRTPVVLSENASLETLVRALALDLGEQAALALMSQYPKAILLTDDAAARLAAEALGYRVHGSIGILLRAIRREQRSPRQVLSILHDLPARSSLHIRPDLLQMIIREVEGNARRMEKD